MRLWREIAKQLAGEDAEPSDVLFAVSAQGGYFESVREIVSFSAEEVLLSVRKKQWRIVGRGLRIEKFVEGDVLVLGEIFSIERTQA